MWLVETFERRKGSTAQSVSRPLTSRLRAIAEICSDFVHQQQQPLPFSYSAQ